MRTISRAHTRKEPTITTPRDALARDLKALRERAGISGRELARRLSATLGRTIDQARISRLDRGLAVFKDDEVQAWARECGASDTDVEELLARAGFAKTETTVWRTHQPGGFIEAQERVAVRERTYSHIAHFTHDVIPGLAQTDEYARDVVRLIGALPSELDANVNARLGRQGVLLNRAKTFTFLLTEGALLWRPGSGPTLAGQLDHLATVVMGQPNITVGLLPYEIQAPTAYDESFTIYGTREGDELVEVETVAGEMTSEDPEKIAAHRRRWDKLHAAALYGDDARALIEDIKRDLAG